MSHKLKAKFEGGTQKIEVDGEEIHTITAISLRTIGAALHCDFTHNDFGGNLTSQEGEIEFVIPDSLAEALIPALK